MAPAAAGTSDADGKSSANAAGAPASSSAWLRRARDHLAAERHREARGDAARALAAARAVDERLRAARLLFVLRDFDAAIAALAACAATGEGQAATGEGSATTAPATAEETLSALELLADRSARVGRYGVTKDALVRAIALDGSRAWLERGADFFAAVDDPDAALSYLARAIAREPDAVELRMKAAERYARAGREDEMRAEVAAAIRLAPSVPKLRLAAAQLLIRSGDYQDAEAHLRAAAAPPPTRSISIERTAHVVAAGQDELVRRMVGPSLPAGWTFLSCRIGDTIAAAYRHPTDGTVARLDLSHPGAVPDSVEDPGHAAQPPSARGAVVLSLRATRPSPSLAFLRAALASSVSAHETELRWQTVTRIETSPLPDDPPEPWLAAVHASLGQLCLWRGDTDGALAAADLSLALDPAHAPALRLRGAARVLRGEHQPARAALDEALRLDPCDAEAHVWLAELCYRRRELVDALREVQRGGELAEDSGDYVAAAILRLSILAARGEYPGRPSHGVPEAMAVLCAGDAPDFDRALARLGGNRSPSLSRLDGSGPSTRLLRLQVPPTPRAPAKLALMQLAAGGPERALRAFAALHAEQPAAPEPHCYHGELFLFLGRYADARREFEAALAIYPRTRWAFIGLGGVLLLEGDAEGALSMLQRGVELSGGPGPTTFIYRGEARRVLGDLGGARSDLEHAHQTQPRRLSALVNLALLELQSGDARAGTTHLARLAADAPTLVTDAAKTLEIPIWDAPLSALHPTQARALLDELLAMMRGNRSSTLLTYFTRAGELRVVPSAPRLDDLAASELRSLETFFRSPPP